MPSTNFSIFSNPQPYPSIYTHASSLTLNSSIYLTVNIQMSSNRKLFKPENPCEDHLYSFSSRCASPVPKRKNSFPAPDNTENLKTSSFISVNTSITRFSSMSGTHEPCFKSVDEGLLRLQSQIAKIHEEYQSTPYKVTQSNNSNHSSTSNTSNNSNTSNQSDNSEPPNLDLDLDSGIPSLRWCAYCKGEITTEVNYVNSGKTFWASLAIFLSGGVFGCFLLPYSLDSCKNLQVRCHRCKHVIEH